MEGLNEYGFFNTAEAARDAVSDFKAYARSNGIETDFHVYRVGRCRGFTLLPTGAFVPKSYVKVSFSTRRNPRRGNTSLLADHARAIAPSTSTRTDLKRNPTTESHELYLFAVNDRQLYQSRILPIIANLKKKIKSGKYNPTLALKLWKYAADDAARRYTKEFGGAGNASYGSFSPTARRDTAKAMQEYYEEALQENPRRRRVATGLTASPERIALQLQFQGQWLTVKYFPVSEAGNKAAKKLAQEMHKKKGFPMRAITAAV